ncbi:MAG: bifunctional phosphoglucose/phosphomannose isomerase [Chloroflexi bacterium]|nr:bifunctional phosphoglucose/phosphomannose isomerase [Chloroflexota bacterium]
MNLDDLSTIKQLDTLNMLGEIDNLPAQLEKAWKLGQHQDAGHASSVTCERVLISGMGGSAIGADLVAAYVSKVCPVPVVVHRDYNLPAWARGPETLFIASSHSGNTEETLDSFDAALKAGCRVLAICTGGELEKRAHSAGVPVWKFEHTGQPRAAVGYSFGLLLAAFARLGLIVDPEEELLEAVAGMRSQQERLRADVPVVQNPAKRMAGQLVERWVNVYGSGILAPVARRWKGQVNEIAKAGAGFEVLPEADHNALAGTLKPSEVLSRTFSLFLRAPSDHPRNRLRSDLTRKTMMLEGLSTDFYDAQGNSPLAQMWTAIHFGDYMAFYLALAYGVDPTPVTALQDFKAEMKASK